MWCAGWGEAQGERRRTHRTFPEQNPRRLPLWHSLSLVLLPQHGVPTPHVRLSTPRLILRDCRQCSGLSGPGLQVPIKLTHPLPRPRVRALVSANGFVLLSLSHRLFSPPEKSSLCPLSSDLQRLLKCQMLHEHLSGRQN